MKPGAFLSLAADVTIDQALCESDVLKVLDARSLYEAYAEEFPYPVHEHVGIVGNFYLDLVHADKLDKSELTDLGDVVGGKAAGRQSPDQIVVFSVGGLPVEDVAWASKVYDRAEREGIGTELLLWDKPALA